MNENAIPKPVLDLLSVPWRTKDDGYCAYTSVWCRDDDRRARPSFYYYRQDDKVPSSGLPLTHDELMALIKAGLLDGIARKTSSNGIAINEHAQHALCDFCEEVYTAYRLLEQRLEEARRWQRKDYYHECTA